MSQELSRHHSYRFCNALDGRDVRLPADPTQKIAFVGVSGSGKSYAAMRLAEEMAFVGNTFCALDPVGIWWGLRVSASRTPDGLPIVVLGGLRGDAPLPDPAAAAGYVIVKGRSCVMDISMLEVEQMHSWTADFMSEAMRLGPRGHRPVHFQLEEAPVLAPQAGLGTEHGRRCRNALAHVARVGRNFGFGMSVITQRAAAVDKNVLTQCGSLLIMRIAAGLDRRAILDWVASNASDDAKAEETLAAVGTLPKGNGYLWAPTWAQDPRDAYCRVVVRTRTTYHPGAFIDEQARGVTMRPVVFTRDLEWLPSYHPDRRESFGSEAGGPPFWAERAQIRFAWAITRLLRFLGRRA